MTEESFPPFFGERKKNYLSHPEICLLVQNCSIDDFDKPCFNLTFALQHIQNQRTNGPLNPDLRSEIIIATYQIAVQ